jgi:uncharacterized membrane-anchored protein YitT (DUF2179 family)
MKLPYKLRREDAHRALISLLLVALGTLSISIGTALFILPFELVTGGISGLSIVISHIYPFTEVPIALIAGALTWACFFLGWAIIGRSFAAKTFFSTLLYPPLLSLFIELFGENSFGGYFYLPAYPYPGAALLLSAVFGGALIGIGCALAFIGGGSTGGTDVLAFMISRAVPKFKSSYAVFVVDASIVLLGVFVIGDMIVSLLGVLAVLISAVVIDKIFLGGSRAFVCEIVSGQYEEINREIIEKMLRTTTVIDVVGGYSGEKKKMLKVSFTMREYASLLSIISRCDKGAFVTIHRAHEINGEGWTF